MNGAPRINVISVYVHPMYNPYSFHNDIAVLRVSSDSDGVWKSDNFQFSDADSIISLKLLDCHKFRFSDERCQSRFGSRYYE